MYSSGIIHLFFILTDIIERLSWERRGDPSGLNRLEISHRPQRNWCKAMVQRLAYGHKETGEVNADLQHNANIEDH